MAHTSDNNYNYSEDDVRLTNNDLAFIALANEYCAALEGVASTEPMDFINSMLKLLPRIYICAFDLRIDSLTEESGYIAPSLQEEQYDAVRNSIAAVLGEDDTFLEVVIQDMKYSDTPIAVTISESLADIYQELYDVLAVCRDAPNYLIQETLTAVRMSFEEHWSRTLANVFRAINYIKFP